MRSELVANFHSEFHFPPFLRKRSFFKGVQAFLKNNIIMKKIDNFDPSHFRPTSIQLNTCSRIQYQSNMHGKHPGRGEMVLTVVVQKRLNTTSCHDNLTVVSTGQ